MVACSDGRTRAIAALEALDDLGRAVQVDSIKTRVESAYGLSA